ncbi:MAG: hypothetical protein AAF639_08815 [Chloroflexota bacterium]
MTKTVQTDAPAAQTRHNDIRAFTLAFFDFFEAAPIYDDAQQLTPEMKSAWQKQDVLWYRLPESLAEHFGRSTIALTFQHSHSSLATRRPLISNGNESALHPVSSVSSYDAELVALGSRVFDNMMAYLERRGALAYQQLPAHFTGSDILLTAVRPLNASTTNLKMQEQSTSIFVFNWRITYRADDKHEELYKVLLDQQGNRLSILRMPDPALFSEELQLRETEAETEAAYNTSSEIETQEPKGSIYDGVDLHTYLVDAEPVPIEQNPDGQPLLPKLPPMTQLTKLAENARKFAIYHADVQCVNREAEVMPRLYKELNKLTRFYQDQIDEVPDSQDPDGEKRRMLEADLERKIAEEVENHRLRVQVNLFSYAILQIPTAVADLTLNDGAHEIPIQIRLDRYNGTLTRPLCHVCQDEVTDLTIDRNGHITCETCLARCETCEGLLCISCGVDVCPVCEKINCNTCSEFCWACGERACQDHISACPTCQDTVCHACQATCASCATRQCRTHLYLDCVVPEREDADANREPELICHNCAVRCTGCNQYSARVASCDLSGQRFCDNCFVTCTSCTKRVGTGFYSRDPVTQQPYCNECLVECPTCRTFTSVINHCSVCEKSCCQHCGDLCDISHTFCCQDHRIIMPNCNHVVRKDYEAHCHVGHELVCPICDAACGICERHYCGEHSKTCQLCECDYCEECIRRSGYCDTCATIMRDGERIANMSEEPCADYPAVGEVISGLRWVKASNQRYTIYVGQNALLSTALVVLDNDAQDGEERRLVHAKKLGFREFIRSRIRRR